MSRFAPAIRSAFLSAFAVATANLFILRERSSVARIRDLRVLRLFARATDAAGWHFLAVAPAWIHRELDLTHLADAAALYAAAIILTVLTLLPLALIAAAILPRTQRSSRAIAALMAVCAMPLVLSTAGSPRLLWMLIAIFGVTAYFVAERLKHVATIAAASIVVALAAAPFAFARHDPAARPLPIAGAPNIVLISIDSLRADHLHAYGYGRNTSPNLDRLASEGALFETTMSPTSWTLPAHMTLLTSLPPEKHGVISERFRLSHSIDTLPQRLQRAGYHTAGIVSATYLDGAFGFSRGFDEYDDYSLIHNAGERSRRDVTSPQLTRQAIDWLRRNAAASAHRPFFLFLHMFDVHYDYNPPEPFAHMFDPVYGGAASGEIGSMRRSMPKRDVQHVIALYDGEIAFVDAHIGNILTALRLLGLDRNTIVVVTADHGEEFFDHGQAGHFKTLYDEVLHVPLIVRYPGRVPAGIHIAGQVRLMDIGPTLLDLAGLRVQRAPSSYEAMSLARFLTQQSAPSLPSFGDLKGKLASIRTDNAKLIWDLTTNRQQFYDLKSDPGETHAVGGAAAIEMREELEQWRATARGSDETLDLEDEEKSNLRSLGYIQ